MKPAELRGMSDEQLGMSLRDTEKHLFKLRFQSATDRLETPSEIRKAKKDIARIKTEQRARELKALAEQSDTQIAAALAHAEKGETADGQPIQGRRRPRRLLNRLTRIQAQRADQKAKAARSQPAAAKGK
jgi:large subunit ribosomal protein L29